MRKTYLECLMLVACFLCTLPGIIIMYRLVWNHHQVRNGVLYTYSTNQKPFDAHTRAVPPKLLRRVLNTAKVQNKRNTTGNCVGNRIYSGRETAAFAFKKRTLVSLHWQFADSKCNVYVYSAYLDDFEWEIRILGIAKVLKTTISVQCHIWTSSSDNHPKPAKGHVWYLPDVMKRSYSAVIISCPVKTRSRPFAVSIVVNDSDIKNIIKINYPSQRNNITVCVPALHSYYKHTHAIISFVEMSRILGAQRFIVYDYSITPEVKLVLDGYANENLVEIVQWDVPVKDIHYFGQNVIINDCLYKNLHVSRYLVYSDLDEIILPRKHTNWMGLIDSILNKDPNVGSFVFRNTFFGTNGNWFVDTKGYNQAKTARTYRVIPLLRVWRDKKIFPPFSRSKLIVIPERVRAVRIHLVDKSMYRNKSKVHVVLPEYGLLHHYRWVSGINEKVKDETVRKYSDQLLGNVKRTHIRFLLKIIV